MKPPGSWEAKWRLDSESGWLPGTDIRHAARIMHERKLGALPVTDGSRVVGMLTASDVIQAVAAIQGEGR